MSLLRIWKSGFEKLVAVLFSAVFISVPPRISPNVIMYCDDMIGRDWKNPT